jgi:hypothetical protein
LDFIALISQEHEQVAAFVSQQGSPQMKAPFHHQTLWEGPDLTFGSSGIQLTDLDADGDLDVLLTNGDAFDNSFVNPSHGVQWLENQGQLKFAYHRLADLTGAYVALPGDIDLDGDLDIITTAWIPPDAKPANALDQPLASLVCLEQTRPGEFAAHALEMDSLIHAALELADFDDDGDLDIAVGCQPLPASQGGSQWVDLWWNQTK